MTRRELINTLREHKVKLDVKEGRLLYEAPAPVPMTLIDGLLEHKTWLLESHARYKRHRERVAWAKGLIAQHRTVTVKTPNDPHDDRRVEYPCDTLEQLLFYRLRADAWSTWGACSAGHPAELVDSWGDVPPMPNYITKGAA